MVSSIIDRPNIEERLDYLHKLCLSKISRLKKNHRYPPPLPQFMNLNVNPVDKRTALIYIDSNGNWHRASKGALEQIMNLCNLREDAKRNIHVIIDKVAEKGPRSLAVTTTPNSTSTFQPTSSNQCSIFHCSKKKIIRLTAKQ